MAGRAEAIASDRVALLAQLGLAQPAAVELDHLGAERLGAEARVLVGLRAAEPVVHVQRRDAVAERAERVPQARRVGSAGDEAAHLPARLDQVVRADVLLDARGQLHVRKSAYLPPQSIAPSRAAAIACW